MTTPFVAAQVAVEAAQFVAHPFPLIRGGGLFLIFVGLGFLIGWFLPQHWQPFAIAGFVLGFLASALSPLIPPPLGIPSFIQVGALILAIVVEVGMITYVTSRFAQSDERTQLLAILLVVGLHFIIMGFAHGPLMALLGSITSINAWLGLRVFTTTPLLTFGVIDSFLKIGFGLWMVLLYPRFTLLFYIEPR